MKDSRHKPKTPRTKRTEQEVPDIYKTSAKEFQKLLKRACQPITEKKAKKKPEPRQSQT